MTESPHELVKRFRSLEASIAKKRGDFALFALLGREDLPDRWDLIVAAPWIGDSREAAEYLVAEIKSQLGQQALVNLSRIIAVEPTDPAVQALNGDFHVEHGATEVWDGTFFGLQIRHAYIITSQRLSPAPAK